MSHCSARFGVGSDITNSQDQSVPREKTNSVCQADQLKQTGGLDVEEWLLLHLYAQL